jgi:hypothetical protein
VKALAALVAVFLGITLLVEADFLFERWSAIPAGLFVWLLGLAYLRWFVTSFIVGSRSAGFWSTLFSWGIWGLILTPFVVWYAARGGYALLVDDQAFFERADSGLSYSRWFGISLILYGLVLAWAAVSGRAARLSTR